MDIRYINIGDKFQIRLEENPSTGYRWLPDRDTLAYFLVSETTIPHPNRELVGAPGHKIFEFTPKSAGEFLVRLVCVRSWEKNKVPVREHAEKVYVQ